MNSLVFKKWKEKRRKAKAAKFGMTVEEFEKANKELKRKEGEERKKFLKWKIEHKYKEKRKDVKSGKGTGVLTSLEMLAGSPTKTPTTDFSTILFGSPPKKKRKKRKKR